MPPCPISRTIWQSPIWLGIESARPGNRSRGATPLSDGGTVVPQLGSESSGDCPGGSGGKDGSSSTGKLEWLSSRGSPAGGRGTPLPGGGVARASSGEVNRLSSPFVPTGAA